MAIVHGMDFHVVGLTDFNPFWDLGRVFRAGSEGGCGFGTGELYFVLTRRRQPTGLFDF